MFIILSQRIDYKSDYEDIPFSVYHYPKRYRNQINTGDVFIYNQGDRRRKENRYYFGYGVIGKIRESEDGEHYYADIENGLWFPRKVSIYQTDGSYFESIDYLEVRKKERPAWQNSIRKISKGAFVKILECAGLNKTIIDFSSIEN